MRQALKGYASGGYATQADVQTFVQEHPLVPKSKSGKVPHQLLGDILRNAIYAGYVEAPCWGISRRKAHYKPLVSLQTYQRIQDRLAGIGRATYRRNLNEDFLLRGFLMCDKAWRGT